VALSVCNYSTEVALIRGHLSYYLSLCGMALLGIVSLVSVFN